MSLQLAQAWINSAICQPHCARQAMDGFDKAAADGVATTMIMGPRLMKNDKCCLVHWTGDELVVLELSPKQRRAFGIEPATMIQELDRRQEPPELPTIWRVNLSDVRVADRTRHDRRKPLAGTFTFEIAESASTPISGCALRARFFQPQMRWRVFGYSHRDLNLPRGELPFAFNPLDSDNAKNPSAGPVVIFFQLVSSPSWSGPTGHQGTNDIQRISNIVARVVEVV